MKIQENKLSMERSQYIKLREQGSAEILFEYYKEKFDKTKHSPFLDYSDFLPAIQMWPGVREAYNMVTEYYDAKFNVLKLPLGHKVMYI